MYEGFCNEAFFLAQFVFRNNFGNICKTIKISKKIDLQTNYFAICETYSALEIRNKINKARIGYQYSYFHEEHSMPPLGTYQLPLQNWKKRRFSAGQNEESEAPGLFLRSHVVFLRIWI